MTYEEEVLQTLDEFIEMGLVRRLDNGSYRLTELGRSVSVMPDGTVVYP